jgi:hypothetical protein
VAAVQVPINMSHGGHCAAFASGLRNQEARKSSTFAGVAVHGNVTIISLREAPSRRPNFSSTTRCAPSDCRDALCVDDLRTDAGVAGANAFEASDVAVKTGERVLFFAKMSDDQVHVGPLTAP